MADKEPGGTRNLAHSLLFAATASLALTACGSNSAQDTSSKPVPPPEVTNSTPASPVEETPRAEGTQDAARKKLVQDIQDERAKNAPSGDPVRPTKTGIPGPEDYGYGTAAAKAQNGEVLAYVPRLDGGRLVVPLTVTNKGDKRAAYTVTVTATGEKGTVPVTVKIPFVYPETTWPTQVDVTAVGSANPNEVEVAVTAAKKNDRWS